MNHAHLRRRDLMKALCAAGLVHTLPALAVAEPPAETTRIRIQDSPITCFAPLYVAEALLKAEGFTDVQYVKTPLAEGPNEALAAGRIDLAQNDSAAHAMSLDAGAPIVVLGGIHTGCWELFVQPSIRSMLDLKGQLVARAREEQPPGVLCRDGRLCGRSTRARTSSGSITRRPTRCGCSRRAASTRSWASCLNRKSCGRER